jgi:hypothetical protein
MESANKLPQVKMIEQLLEMFKLREELSIYLNKQLYFTDIKDILNMIDKTNRAKAIKDEVDSNFKSVFHEDFIRLSYCDKLIKLAILYRNEISEINNKNKIIDDIADNIRRKYNNTFDFTLVKSYLTSEVWNVNFHPTSDVCNNSLELKKTINNLHMTLNDNIGMYASKRDFTYENYCLDYLQITIHNMVDTLLTKDTKNFVTCADDVMSTVYRNFIKSSSDEDIEIKNLLRSYPKDNDPCVMHTTNKMLDMALTYILTNCHQNQNRIHTL